MGWVYDRKDFVILLFGLLLLWPAFTGRSIAAGGTEHAPPASKRVKLFGTIEFKSSLKALRQWARVLSVVKQQVRELSECKENCAPSARSWQKIIRQSRGQSPMDQLKAVNRFFNQWPYRLDIERYGVSDYWATPEEFMKLSGDCEDYSIAKYFALKQLGFDPQNLRIVVVKDRIRNIGHAVLAVYMDDTAYILDNLSNLVFSHRKYGHYLPQYSVNETNRWAHVKPMGEF